MLYARQQQSVAISAESWSLSAAPYRWLLGVIQARRPQPLTSTWANHGDGPSPPSDFWGICPGGPAVGQDAAVESYSGGGGDGRARVSPSGPVLTTGLH